MIYVNFVIEGLKLVPIKLRFGRQKAWVESLLQPLKSFQSIVTSRASSWNYEMRFNGQVMYIEHYLNDILDNGERRIFINDPFDFEPLMAHVFNKIEGRETLVVYNKSEGVSTNTFVYNANEFDNAPDFVVNVPSDIASLYSSAYIKSLVNKYRLAGKRYTIEIF
jgi:hypothetical protein